MYIGKGGLYKPQRSMIYYVCLGENPYSWYQWEGGPPSFQGPLVLFGLRVDRFKEDIFWDDNIVWDTDFHRVIAFFQEK